MFHPSYINFCGSYPNSHAWLEATSKHIESVGSSWFAQDVAYCFWEEGPGYSTQLGYFIHLSLINVLSNLRLNVLKKYKPKLRAGCNRTTAVAFIIGSMPLFSFFGSLANQTDCAILLDMGHLVSYEMASGRSVLEAIDELPVERVIEVHIAGGRLKGRR